MLAVMNRVASWLAMTMWVEAWPVPIIQSIWLDAGS